MEVSFQRLGWTKCRWSGFRIYLNKKMDDCGPGHWYSENAIVLGWRVYEFRIWVHATSEETR